MISEAIRILAQLKLTRPFIFMGLCYLTGLIYFSFFRLLFALEYSDQLTNTTGSEILTAFLIGLRFDTVIILAILAVPNLLLPWLTLKFKPVRWLTISYLSVMFAFCFLMLIGDIGFYKVAQTHLNHMALDYLADGQTAWTLISRDANFIYAIILWLICSVSFAYVATISMRYTSRLPERRSWSGQAVLYVVLVMLTMIGMRGRVQLSPIRWGVAYFSQNQFLNQLGLNGIWCFFETLGTEGGDNRLISMPEAERFPLVSFDESLKATQTMLVQPDERLLEPDSSLRRLKQQPENSFGFQPNVVIVMMESWSGTHTGALGADLGITPQFDSLAEHGLLFTNFYAGGERTNFGMPAILCSAPALPGRAVMKRYNALHSFRSLSEILNERGYYNLLAYGGDKVFDNIDGFFRSKLFDDILGDDDFGKELVFAKWGIPDHILFEKITELTDTIPRPFNISVLTLSNHEPNDLPDSSTQLFFDDSYQSQIKNVFAYADYAIGHFIKLISSKPVFDSTIFVFTADHTRQRTTTRPVDPNNFYIPLLIYSPTLLGDEKVIIERVGGQVDILPTLMGLLGSDYEHESWGQNLLADRFETAGFAFMRASNRLGLMEKDFFYMEPLGLGGSLYEYDSNENGSDKIGDKNIADQHPEIFSRMQTRLRRYFQTAEQLSTPGAVGTNRVN